MFGPFWRAVQTHLGDSPPTPAPRPEHLRPFIGADRSDDLDAWRLKPTAPDWSGGFAEWKPGEAAAADCLGEFIDRALPRYPQTRDLPSEDGTSRLSPHLAWGEIGPRRILASIQAAEALGDVGPAAAEKLLAELGWREFSHHSLHTHPDLATRNLRPEFDAFPWRDDPQGLDAWRRGRTGYPIVDAGMRQLWATGWMHNRVRMIAASFLIKHLMIDWRVGERWFWDTLVDADPASNPVNWQWVAGSGIDASPFFRIFNPTAQAEKFDPSGAYVRRWVPELAHLQGDLVHQPWIAPLEAPDYPAPIVDHGMARARALQAFRSLRAIA